MSLPLLKPAPGSGRLERFERRLQKRRIKANADKLVKQAEQRRQRQVRFFVYLRDRKRCRAFNTPLLFETDNLKKNSHAHHLIFRSAGGADTSDNLITVGVVAHRMLHEGYLEATGNGDELVTFTEYEFKGGTRQIVRTWESRA